MGCLCPGLMPGPPDPNAGSTPPPLSTAPTNLNGAHLTNQLTSHGIDANAARAPDSVDPLKTSTQIQNENPVIQVVLKGDRSFQELLDERKNI